MPGASLSKPSGPISVTFSNDIPPSSQLTYYQYTILDLFGGLKYFFTFDTVLIEPINRTSVFIDYKRVFPQILNLKTNL